MGGKLDVCGIGLAVWLVGYTDVVTWVGGVMFTCQDDGPLFAVRICSESKVVKHRAVADIFAGGEEVPSLNRFGASSGCGTCGAVDPFDY